MEVQIKYVTVKRMAELTGYSVSAIQTKITRGFWPEGPLWIKAPDGRRLINVENFNRWVANENIFRNK